MALTKIDDRGLKTPIDLLDNEKIRFGTGNDLEIRHDGTDSRIINTTGNLTIKSDNILGLYTYTGTEAMAKFNANGAVELYYDNSLKLKTTSTGLELTPASNNHGLTLKDTGEVYPALTFDVNRSGSDQFLGNIIGKWNGTTVANIIFETGADTTNKDEGIISFRTSVNGGERLRIDEAGRILAGITSSSTNTRAIIQGRSDNANTTGTLHIQRGTANPANNSGLGKITFADSASAEGAYIYAQAAGQWASDDYPTRLVFTTTADNASSPTEKLRIESDGNVNIPNDSAKLQLGASQDLQIYHNGSQNIIGDTATQLRLISDAIRLRSATGSETYLEADVDGAVKIYHDNEQIFETNSSGVKVSNPNGEGTITIEGGEGGSASLYLYADQADDNDDKFRLRKTDGGNFWLEYYNGSAWEDSLKAVADAGVALYYNNSPKFETVSSGAEIVKQLVLYSNTDKDEGEIKLNARNSSEDDDYVWIGCRNSNTSAYNWQVSGAANVFAAGSHMIGRQRDNSPNPTDTYRNADFLRFQSYQGTNDETAYKARCLMGTANSDWDDRRIFYYADSQDDTTACDYDQDQTVSISGSGRANFKSAVWSGRVESDEGGPNSVYYTGEIGFIAYADSTQNQTNCYARNVADSTSTYYVKVGNSARFVVEADGTCKADNTTNLSDADYAECFEWTDGNTSSQERRGMTVVLDGEKVKLATDSDNKDNIIGVVSPHPAVLGDSASLGWHGRYKTDVYGSTIKKEHEWLIWKKEYHYEDGVKVLCEQPDPNKPQTLEDAERVKVENIEREKAKGLIPDFAITNNIRYKSYANQIDTENYDTSKPYIPRKDRKEWDAIGMVGKLIVRRGQPVGTRWLLMKENIGTDTDGTVLDRYLVR